MAVPAQLAAPTNVQTHSSAPELYALGQPARQQQGEVSRSTTTPSLMLRGASMLHLPQNLIAPSEAHLHSTLFKGKVGGWVSGRYP